MYELRSTLLQGCYIGDYRGDDVGLRYTVQGLDSLRGLHGGLYRVPIKGVLVGILGV